MKGNKTETWGDIDAALENPHSVITSVDTKLVYDQEKDRFEAVMVGDVNAFPEGLSLQSNWDETGDLVRATAEALVEQVPGENPAVAVNKPGHIYDSENSAIIRGKNDIIDEIERLVDETYEVMDGQGLESTEDNSELQVDGQPVDGYINISDRATGLDSISNNHVERGAQAPTAVWNTEIPQTGKIGLLNTAESVTAETENVHTPDFFTVESPEEIVDYFEQGNSVVLKADQYGTHGDDVVSLDWDEYQTALNRGWIGPELEHTKGLIDSPLDYIETKIENEERRVQAKGNRPDDFKLYEDGEFKGPGPGLVEEAVAGEYSIDGNTYTVVDRDDQPVDFVPVTIYNPETSEAETESQLVRASATEDLNANRGFANFDPKHVEYSWEQGFDDVYEDGSGALQDTLEEIAGRSVSLEDEILPVLEEAGQAAYRTRNASSYNALDVREAA